MDKKGFLRLFGLRKQWSTYFIVSQANDKQINQLFGSSHRFVLQSGKKNFLSEHDACMNTLNGHYVSKERSMILFGVNFQRNSDHSKLWSVQFGECDTKLLKLLTFWVVGNDSESGMSHVTVTSYCCKKEFLSQQEPQLMCKNGNRKLFPKAGYLKKKYNFLQFFPIPDCTLPGKPKSNSQYNVCMSQARSSRRRRQDSFFQRLSPGNTTLESPGDSSC